MTDDFKVDLKTVQARCTWRKELHPPCSAQDEMAKEKQTYEELMAGKKEEIKALHRVVNQRPKALRHEPWRETVFTERTLGDSAGEHEP